MNNKVIPNTNQDLYVYVAYSTSKRCNDVKTKYIPSITHWLVQRKYKQIIFHLFIDIFIMVSTRSKYHVLKIFICLKHSIFRIIVLLSLTHCNVGLVHYYYYSFLHNLLHECNLKSITALSIYGLPVKNRKGLILIPFFFPINTTHVIFLLQGHYL